MRVGGALLGVLDVPQFHLSVRANCHILALTQSSHNMHTRETRARNPPPIPLSSHFFFLPLAAAFCFSSSSSAMSAAAAASAAATAAASACGPRSAAACLWRGRSLP